MSDELREALRDLKRERDERRKIDPVTQVLRQRWLKECPWTLPIWTYGQLRRTHGPLYAFIARALFETQYRLAHPTSEQNDSKNQN
jgi:hypothetical protein